MLRLRVVLGMLLYTVELEDLCEPSGVHWTLGDRKRRSFCMWRELLQQKRIHIDIKFNVTEITKKKKKKRKKKEMCNTQVQEAAA